MANIRVDVNSTIKDGSEIVFIAPCDCSEITKLNVHYLDKDGNDTSTSFVFKDAHGNELFDVDLFAKGAYVKVILNVTEGIAYIQNADTNKYIEGQFEEVRSAIDEVSKIELPTNELGDWNVISINESVRDITFGNDMFVATTSNGAIYSSDNGIDWVRRFSTGANTNDIAFGNGRFVAVGNTAYYSDNGIDWTRCEITNNPTFAGVTYGNDKFVAIGMNTTDVYVSEDGITWVSNTVFESNLLFSNIAYGNGKFVAVSEMGYTYYSSDGIDWLECNNSSIEAFLNVTYGEDKFVAVGEGAYYSSDGIEWVASTLVDASYLRGVAYGKGKFVTAGNTGNVYVSNDGIEWVASELNTDIFSIAYGNEKFVAVSGNEICYAGFKKEVTDVESAINDIYTQELPLLHQKLANLKAEEITVDVIVGLKEWTQGEHPNNSASSDMVYGNGKFVAVGNHGSTCYSIDGVNWVLGDYVGNEGLLSIAYGNNKFVTANVIGTIFYSEDGITWSEANTFYKPIKAITYGNGKFVCIDSDFSNNKGNIITSEDGITWSEVGSINDGTIMDIIYSDGKFVAVGAFGIHYSEDGTNWSAVENPPMNSMTIAYGNGKFVISGSGQSTRYSEDLVEWIECYDVGFQKIIYTGEIFIGIGDDIYCHTSKNGVDWKIENMILDDDDGDTRTAMAYGNNIIAIIGYNSGIIMYSSIVKRTENLANIINSLL